MPSKIAVISPSSTLTSKVKIEIDRMKLDVIVRQAAKQEAVNEAQELILKGVKVFISRGNVAMILRNNFDVPVVEIKHTFFDCYFAYQNAKQYSDRIAFLATSEGYEKILNKSKVFLPGAEILRIDNTLNDAALIENQLKAMKDMGIEVAIGGLSLEKQVRSLGIQYVMSEADHDSILEALDEAMHLQKIEMERDEHQHQLENRYELINSILNCTSEGIISIDRECVINEYNRSAEKLVGSNLKGKILSMVIQSDRLKESVKKGLSFSGEVVSVGNLSLVVNLEPIKSGLHVAGAVVTIQRSIQIQAIEQKIRNSLLNKGHVSDKTFDDIIGTSNAIQATKDLARRYATVDSTVLILGETGTGKELFAQSIHNESKRHVAPFVAINCAAFPANILESELFGYVKGAFTGASSEGKAGIFELAHKGTIFLDEISEAPLDVQLKLLRVIQERKIIRIGDDKVIPVDVRIITASNKDLKHQIKLGLFREDFYYRICVLELRVPPLKERREDIPALVRYFIENGHMKARSITNKASDLLAKAEWPGNVRQLSNIIERLLVFCDSEIIDSDMVIGLSDLDMNNQIDLRKPGSQYDVYQIPPIKKDHDQANEQEKDRDNRQHTLYDPLLSNNPESDIALSEVALIRRALIDAKGNRQVAAERLGISTTTLWRKIKKLDLIDDQFLTVIRYGQK